MAQQKKKYPFQRPLDPTRDARDLMGDTTGRTGVTEGGAEETSATPVPHAQGDKDHLPGGVIRHPTHPESTQEVSDAIAMSSTKKAYADNAASEHDTTMPDANDVRHVSADKAASSLSQNTTGSQTPSRQPYNEGESSVSGSTPDVESDDDTLQNAQAMGQQLEEDSEHPEELDIARDIDKAEEYIKTH